MSEAFAPANYINSPSPHSHVEQHGAPGVDPEFSLSLSLVEHERVALGRHEPLHLAHQAGAGAPGFYRQRLRHAGLSVPAVRCGEAAGG